MLSLFYLFLSSIKIGIKKRNNAKHSFAIRLIINFLYFTAMQVKVTLDNVPEEMIDSVYQEMEDLGYKVLSIKSTNPIVVIKDAEKIRLNQEMYGFSQLYGIKGIEYI